MLGRGVSYLLSIACLTMAHPAAAELRAPGLFTDHAVLQRGKPIHVWGTATPGSEIRITLHRQQAQGIADTLGKWDAWLAPEVAGGPYELTIAGDGSTMKAQDGLPMGTFTSEDALNGP